MNFALLSMQLWVQGVCTSMTILGLPKWSISSDGSGILLEALTADGSYLTTSLSSSQDLKETTSDDLSTEQ